MTPAKKNPENFVSLCESFLHAECKAVARMTPSCSAALELACGVIGLRPGDEVVVPAFTFPTVASSVILRGAVPVFADVRGDTLNLDETRVLEAMGPRTRAVMVIHYAGVTADMGALRSICRSAGVYLIEDAAQSIGSWQCSGDLGCMSFHDTKNVGCGEGGAIFVKNMDLLSEVEVLRDSGVSRNPVTGERYRWEGVGQSVIMGEPCARELWAGLQDLPEVTNRRRAAWRVYRDEVDVRERAYYQGNGHIFWFLTENRDAVVRDLRSAGVHACSHYEAAHLCAPGVKHGRIGNDLSVSERVAAQIVRLPTNVSEDEARANAEIVNRVMKGFSHEREEGRGIRRVEAGRSEPWASVV